MGDFRKRVPEALLGAIVSRGDIRCFAAGRALFFEGDESDGLYVLLTGQLKVFTDSAGGRQMVYNILGPGEMLGEISLDGGPRSASVEAMVNVECVVLGNEVARTMMRTHPAFFDLVIAKLAARARRSTSRARSIALDGVPERVIALLEESATGPGQARRIPYELTQQEIADRIGASRVMVHRVLRELVDAGYLRREGRRMHIVGPPPEFVGRRRKRS